MVTSIDGLLYKTGSELSKEKVSHIHYLTPKTYAPHDTDIIFPIIAKPKESGSSVGIYFIENQNQLHTLLHYYHADQPPSTLMI